MFMNIICSPPSGVDRRMAGCVWSHSFSDGGKLGGGQRIR